MAFSDLCIQIVAETKGFEKADKAMAQTKLSLEEMIKLFNSVGEKFGEEQLRHTKEMNKQIEETKKKRSEESQILTKQFREKRFENAENRKERNNDALMVKRLATAEEAHKKAMLRTQREELKLEKDKEKILEGRNTKLGSMIGKYLTIAALMKVVGIATQGSARIERYNLQGDITQLKPSDIKTFVYTGRRYGATEESARQMLSSTTSQVEAFKRGENPQLAESLGRAGIQTTMRDFENAFTLMSAVSKGMKSWSTPEEIRQGFDILKSIFDPSTLLMLKSGFDKEMESAKDLVLVKPEDEKKAQMLYDMFTDLGYIMKEFKDKFAVGMTAVLPPLDDITKSFKELAPVVELFGKGIGLLFSGFGLGKLTQKALGGIETGTKNVLSGIERGTVTTLTGLETGGRGTGAALRGIERGTTMALSSLGNLAPTLMALNNELNTAKMLMPQNIYNTQNTGGQISLNMTNNTTVSSVNEAAQFTQSMGNLQLQMADNLNQRTGFSVGSFLNDSSK